MVEQSATTFTVTANGAATSVPRSAVQRIEARLGGGDDQYFSPSVSIQQWVYCGPGNDHVLAGKGSDRLYGELGNDVLEGRGGKDFLYGQQGNDRLHGGDDVDWLSGAAGHDILDALGDNLPDRLVGVTASDSVFYDSLSSVRPAEVLQHQTNHILFFGESIELRRTYFPGVEGIFFTVRINGQPWGSSYRAAGQISVFVPRAGGTITIDPILEGELNVLGLLRRELLG